MTEAADTDFKIVITDAQMKLRKLKLDPEFLLAHEIMLEKKNALIPFIESNLMEMTIPQDSSH